MQDLASSEMQAKVKALEEQNLWSAQGAQAKASETDMFKCGRVRHRYERASAESSSASSAKCVECCRAGADRRFSAPTTVRRKRVVVTLTRTEMQTRSCVHARLVDLSDPSSADEPMTTFVMCTVCSNRVRKRSSWREADPALSGSFDHARLCSRPPSPASWRPSALYNRVLRVD